MTDTKYYPTKPNQTVYLDNYSNDTPENIKKVVNIFSCFQQDGVVPTNETPNFKSINTTTNLSNITARVYSEDISSNFNLTIDNTSYTLTLDPGAVIIENTLIELTSTNVITVDDTSYYLTNFTIPDDTTSYYSLAVYYDSDSSSFESGALLGLVDESGFVENKMCSVYNIRIIKSSGTITDISSGIDDISGVSLPSVYQTFVPHPIYVYGGLLE